MNFANVKEWRIPVNGVTRDVLRVTRNNIVLWEKQTVPDYTEPFYVENITDDDETLSIVKSDSSAPTLTIEYSTDKSNWTTFENPTSTTALTLPLVSGEKVYLRCNTNAWSAEIQRNTIRGVSKVGGNIMSLLYGNNFTGQETIFPSGSTYNFQNLFSNNTNLVNASELLLPATTLTRCCYEYMFAGCNGLRSAPALPATTLAIGCYESMFTVCASLTSAPALPATTLRSNCYSSMFRGCTSLTSAPALPATTLADTCYAFMFYGCTRLSSAPALPATTLVSYCYYGMFNRCTELNNVVCLATSGINTDNSTSLWLDYVASTGTFTKAAGVTWPSGASGIPSGWTVVEV